MKLYLLEPEVAGGLGGYTILSNSKEVIHLHYEFSGWLGDELLETTPCFIVTESLATAIKNSPLKGYRFGDVEVSVSDEFLELYPERKLPPFRRLIPMGTVKVEGKIFSNWSKDDFCISQNKYLVITESALNTLNKFSLDNCDITELNK